MELSWIRNLAVSLGMGVDPKSRFFQR